MKSSYDKIKTLGKEEVVRLLHEIKTISNTDKPSLAKHTVLMADLFKLEKTEHNHWADQFFTVRRYIESNIIDRVLNGELK